MSRLRLVQNQFRCLVTRCKQSACKGGLLTYRFFVEREGDYSLTTALIPTHAVDAGDIIRYSVTVDDAPVVTWSPKEPFRSEEWKRNVLRAQALRHQKVHLSAGSHQLTIQALDDHVVVDQWKLSTSSQSYCHY